MQMMVQAAPDWLKELRVLEGATEKLDLLVSLLLPLTSQLVI